MAAGGIGVGKQQGRRATAGAMGSSGGDVPRWSRRPVARAAGGSRSGIQRRGRRVAAGVAAGGPGPREENSYTSGRNRNQSAVVNDLE